MLESEALSRTCPWLMRPYMGGGEVGEKLNELLSRSSVEAYTSVEQIQVDIGSDEKINR